MGRLAAAVAAGTLLLGGCTADPPASSGTPAGAAPTQPPATTSAVSPTPTVTATRAAEPTPEPTPELTPRPRLEPEPTARPPRAARIDAAGMLRTVRALAGGIGPREATSPAYRRAAVLVQRRFEGLGYPVSRQIFDVPAGESWGVPVPAGRAANVVAVPPGFDPRRPHLLLGAHLDTVPQAPGAEDNASGVAVLLEVARLAALAEPPLPTMLPTVFVAFGAEEPRGPGDDLHHFGSRHYVRTMAPAQRRALVGMLSLDRVGVGRRVPVCWAGRGDGAFARRVLRAGQAAGVPVRLCDDNRSSDHWSFERAGLPAARLGSTPYAAYHSPADRPRVVDAAQLARSARVAWRLVSSARRR